MSVPGPAHARETDSFADRYRVLDRLGRGGVAEVLRVRDHDGAELALKRLLPQPDMELFAVLRWQLEREFHTLSHLHHPNVVRVFDYGVCDGQPYYTMEVLDGRDLVELGRQSWRDACAIAYGIASALSLLHSRRLLHRDVSIRNIRLKPDGTPVLFDFGAMAPMGRCPEVIGTPPYVAPEALLGHALDGRVDLYALGACLYRVLTGRHAFYARDFNALQRAWETPPAPPSSMVAAIPAGLDALVLGLLAQRPAARPATAGALMQKLEAVAGPTLALAEQASLGDDAHGVVGDDSPAVARAHLVTPPLVGRDAELERFRAWLSQLRSTGTGLCAGVLGDPGVGRSRMLDACVLEAQLSGVNALRASLSVGSHAAGHLLSHLSEQLERRAEAREETRTQPGKGEHGPRDDASEETADPVLARVTHLLAAAHAHPLLIALDDLERADPATLRAVEALRAHTADTQLMLLLGSRIEGTDAPDEDDGRVALRRRLLAQANTLSLEPLSRDHSESLLRSIFGDVPHVALLASRLHPVAHGLPQALLQWSEHMIDAGLIRYDRGEWILPTRLRAKDLPRRPRELDAQRLRGLSQDATRLARVLSLRPEGSFSLDDLLAMSGDATERMLDGLDELHRAGVVELRDARAAFARPHLAHAFTAGLAPDALADGHRRMAELVLRDCSPEDPRRLVAAQHWLSAGDTIPALQLAATYAEAVNQAILDRTGPGGASPLPESAVELLEAMLRLASQRERPLCERLSMWLSLVLAPDHHERVSRYGPQLLKLLARDCGLSDYAGMRARDGRRAERAATDGEAYAPRTQDACMDEALARVRKRYQRTPVSERGLSPELTGRFLAPVLARCLIAAMGNWDYPLLCACPDPTPLRARVPELAPLCDVIGAAHAMFAGVPQTALSRLGAAMDGLATVTQNNPPSWLVALRARMLFWLGTHEAALGMPGGRTRARELSDLPDGVGAAAQIERLYWLALGDLDAADRCHRQCELVHIREEGDEDDAHATLVAVAWLSARLGDVSEIKRAVDAHTRVPAQNATLNALQALSLGALAETSGDLAGAIAHYRACLSLPDPTDMNATGPWRPDLDALRRNPVWPIALQFLCGCMVAAHDAAGALDLLAAFDDACEALGIARSTWAETRARIALSQGRNADALSICERGLQACIRWQRRGEQPGQLWALTAQAAAALGRTREAQKALSHCRDHWDGGRDSVLGLRYQRLTEALGPLLSRSHTLPPGPGSPNSQATAPTGAEARRRGRARKHRTNSRPG